MRRSSSYTSGISAFNASELPLFQSMSRRVTSFCDSAMFLSLPSEPNRALLTEWQYMCFCLSALLAMLTLAPALAQSSVEGDWAGTLKQGASELRLILHIRPEGSKFTAKMDVPEQGALGIPVNSVSFNDPAVHFEVANLGVTFEGKFGLGKIAGTFEQR